MLEEYHLLAVALRQAAGHVAGDARACIVLAESPEDAAAQAQLWACETLPPQFGWEGHTIRVERLAVLLPGVARCAD